MSSLTDKLEIFLRPDKERGVKAKVPFRPGEFICEFEANLLTKEECLAAEEEYERDGIAVYILEVIFIV